MTISEKVQALLIADAGVTALVPAARIKTPGNWQSLAKPYIIHFAVSAEPTQMHNGRAALTIWEYQVSVFASSYITGEAAAIAARDALAGRHTDAQIEWTGGPYYAGYEADVDVHHFVLAFRIGSQL